MKNIKSSQVIILDEDNNIYLENNKKYNCVSLFWWKIEVLEEPVEAIIRELKEELDLIVSIDCLDFIERETENLKHWKFKSYLYLLRISNESWEYILDEKYDSFKLKFEDFDKKIGKTMIEKNNLKRKLKSVLMKKD